METNNTRVTGAARVGGLFGDNYGSDYVVNKIHHAYVNDCEITGTGYYVGGLMGASSKGLATNVLVLSTDVYNDNVNSRYIGGAVGGMVHTYLQNIAISRVNILTSGGRIGGVVGGNSGAFEIGMGYGYVDDVFVSGGFDVGGVLGLSRWSWLDNLYVKANVKASVNTAGGMIGYIDNSNMAGASDITSIRNVLILDSTIEAPTRAGGLVGSIAKEIYRDQSFYYNNYIDADVTSTNTSTGSLIIGGRPDENSYVTNTYIYKYSTLNGDYVYTTNDNIDDDQYLVRSDLDVQSTYSSKIGLGTTYWSYTSLQEGKYPKIADSYLYHPELQTGVDLPTDPEISSINSLSVGDEKDDNNTNEAGANANNIVDENGISTQSIESLPSYKVYPTSVDEVNIDFSDIPEETSFIYYVNGEEKEIVELTQKTYTFKYNYQDTLGIKLTNGTDEETVTINPEDVRSEASLVGNNNAYLLGTSLYINGELQQGEYVNVYGGYALNSTGQILDIATKQLISENVSENNTDEDSTNENSDNEADAEITDEVASSKAVTTSLQQTATPLHTYNYNGSTIETYGTYSTVNGNIKQQIYNVRSGGLSALSNSLDMKIDNYIVDNYNNKEYQTILTSNGELEDLKEILQYPDNFLSNNIKQNVQNTDVEKTEMMVLYNTGKVIVFDYVTGNVIYENDEKADEGLVGYLTRSFANIWNDYEDRWQEYAKSKELEAKLAKLPVSEAIQKASNNSGTNAISNSLASSTNINQNDNDTNSISVNNTNNASGNQNSTTDNSYITVYNADTGEYEVYSEDEILNGEDENPVSETTKIKENGLESVYNYETNEESKPQANGAVIVVSIIAVAIIALIVLRKVVIKNNMKKQTK